MINDTIVACSTPQGLGAIAVVRLSGPDAVAVASRLCPRLPSAPEPRHTYLVGVHDPQTDELIDRGVATVYRRPASYTGEDVVELSCHGGWLTPVLVVDAATRAGCRQAEPGEFTRRAYLHGKVDLLQAEAVMDVVAGRSRALRRAALGQLERGLSDRVGALREGVVRLEALLAHHIDFPEEDEAPVAIETVAGAADRVVAEIDGLLATAPEGELLREGAVTVLAGRPNAGKSSLFNALLGEERAIVTDTPGTTRDAVEGVITVEGYPFRLVDTAGIRESAEAIERMGVEVARRYLARADLVLLCVETGNDVDDDELALLADLDTVPAVFLRTKADRRSGGTEADSGDGSAPDAPLPVSVTTGAGLAELRRRLPRLVYRGLVESAADATVLTHRRHVANLRKAGLEVRAFSEGLRAGVPAEVVSTHLRPAETALEELLGVISTDDVLDIVFREFCIGK